MKALSLTVVVHVSNVETAMKYYTEVLGFKFDFQFGDYAGLVYDKVYIHLNGPSNPDTQKKLPGNAHFCIECDEIDIYYKAIVEKGAVIEVPLGDRLYGMRDCAVNDPDGNIIVFGKVIE